MWYSCTKAMVGHNEGGLFIHDFYGLAKQAQADRACFVQEVIFSRRDEYAIGRAML